MFSENTKWFLVRVDWHRGVFSATFVLDAAVNDDSQDDDYDEDTEDDDQDESDPFSVRLLRNQFKPSTSLKP